MRMNYHNRRVLGSIVYAKDGIKLDDADQRHALVLILKKMVEYTEKEDGRLYRATAKGSKWWYDGITPR